MVGLTAPTDLASDAFAPSAENPFEAEVRKQIDTLEEERVDLPANSSRRSEIENEIKGLDFVLSRSGSASSSSKSRITIKGGDHWIDKYVLEKWKKNPGLMLYKLQSNGYKFSWLLIPLSLPFLWLMFAWRRQFKAYDHAVFITYSLSFMSLLFIVMSIMVTIPSGAEWAALLFMIAGPVHLYKQLRYAYGLGRFSAVWRFCVLLVCTQIVITLFLLILSVLGAF